MDNTTQKQPKVRDLLRLSDRGARVAPAAETLALLQGWDDLTEHLFSRGDAVAERVGAVQRFAAGVGGLDAFGAWVDQHFGGARDILASLGRQSGFLWGHGLTDRWMASFSGERTEGYAGWDAGTSALDLLQLEEELADATADPLTAAVGRRPFGTRRAAAGPVAARVQAGSAPRSARGVAERRAVRPHTVTAAGARRPPLGQLPPVVLEDTAFSPRALPALHAALSVAHGSLRAADEVAQTSGVLSAPAVANLGFTPAMAGVPTPWAPRAVAGNPPASARLARAFGHGGTGGSESPGVLPVYPFAFDAATDVFVAPERLTPGIGAAVAGPAAGHRALWPAASRPTALPTVGAAGSRDVRGEPVPTVAAGRGLLPTRGAVEGARLPFTRVVPSAASYPTPPRGFVTAPAQVAGRGRTEGSVERSAASPHAPAARPDRYAFAADLSVLPTELFATSVWLRAEDSAAASTALRPGAMLSRHAHAVSPAESAGARGAHLVASDPTVYVSLSGETGSAPVGAVRHRADHPAGVQVARRFAAQAVTVPEAVRLQQALAAGLGTAARGQGAVADFQRTALATPAWQRVLAHLAPNWAPVAAHRPVPTAATATAAVPAPASPAAGVPRALRNTVLPWASLATQPLGGHWHAGSGAEASPGPSAPSAAWLRLSDTERLFVALAGGDPAAPARSTTVTTAASAAASPSRRRSESLALPTGSIGAVGDVSAPAPVIDLRPRQWMTPAFAAAVAAATERPAVTAPSAALPWAVTPAAPALPGGAARAAAAAVAAADQRAGAPAGLPGVDSGPLAATLVALFDAPAPGRPVRPAVAPTATSRAPSALSPAATSVAGRPAPAPTDTASAGRVPGHRAPRAVPLLPEVAAHPYLPALAERVLTETSHRATRMVATEAATQFLGALTPARIAGLNPPERAYVVATLRGALPREVADPVGDLVQMLGDSAGSAGSAPGRPEPFWHGFSPRGAVAGVTRPGVTTALRDPALPSATDAPLGPVAARALAALAHPGIREHFEWVMPLAEAVDRVARVVAADRPAALRGVLRHLAPATTTPVGRPGTPPGATSRSAGPSVRPESSAPDVGIAGGSAGVPPSALRGIADQDPTVLRVGATEAPHAAATAPDAVPSRAALTAPDAVFLQTAGDVAANAPSTPVATERTVGTRGALRFADRVVAQHLGAAPSHRDVRATAAPTPGGPRIASAPARSRSLGFREAGEALADAAFVTPTAEPVGVSAGRPGGAAPRAERMAGRPRQGRTVLDQRPAGRRWDERSTRLAPVATATLPAAVARADASTAPTQASPFGVNAAAAAARAYSVDSTDAVLLRATPPTASARAAGRAAGSAPSVLGPSTVTLAGQPAAPGGAPFAAWSRHLSDAVLLNAAPSARPTGAAPPPVGAASAVGTDASLFPAAASHVRERHLWSPNLEQALVRAFGDGDGNGRGASATLGRSLAAVLAAAGGTSSPLGFRDVDLTRSLVGLLAARGAVQTAGRSDTVAGRLAAMGTPRGDRGAAADLVRPDATSIGHRTQRFSQGFGPTPGASRDAMMPAGETVAMPRAGGAEPASVPGMAAAAAAPTMPGKTLDLQAMIAAATTGRQARSSDLAFVIPAVQHVAAHAMRKDSGAAAVQPVAASGGGAGASDGSAGGGADTEKKLQDVVDRAVAKLQELLRLQNERTGRSLF